MLTLSIRRAPRRVNFVFKTVLKTFDLEGMYADGRDEMFAGKQ